MSNFICPYCGEIIDNGSDGFTSDREIELEQQLEYETMAKNEGQEIIAELEAKNKELEKKLEIAVKALICISGKYFTRAFSISRKKFAQQALKEIEE